MIMLLKVMLCLFIFLESVKNKYHLYFKKIKHN